MYAKAVYRVVMTRTPIYIENLCIWVKTAIWDAPKCIFLDIDSEISKIEMEQAHLSKVGDHKNE